MKLILRLLLLICLLLISIAWLLLSEQGLRFTIAAIPLFSAQRLHIQSASGRLLGSLTLNDIQYHSDTTKIDIQKLELVWQPSCLWQGKVVINQLQVQGIKLSLSPPVANTKAKSSLGPLRAINIKSITLLDVNLLQPQSMLPLHFQELQGQLNLQEQAKDQLAWQLQLQAHHMNLGNSWPADISFNLNSHGWQQADNFQACMQLPQLYGRLHGQQINGLADIDYSSEGLTIKQLHLHAGDAWLESRGHLQSDWQLEWLLHIPQLQALIPNSGGKLDSQGQLNGSLAQPQIDANLTVANFFFQDKKIQQLQAKLQIKTDKTAQLTLNAQNIQLAQQLLQRLNIQGQGTLQEHNFASDLLWNNGQLKFALNGKLKDKTWTGLLKNGEWRSSRLAIPFSGSLSASCRSNNIQLQLQLASSYKQQLWANIQLPGYQLEQKLLPQQAVLGKIKVELPYLEKFPLPFPISGQYKMAVDMQGTLAKPTIQGHMDIAKASVTLPQLGIKLEDIQANAQGNLSNITLQAQTRSGKGKLFVNGIAQPAGNAWKLDIQAKGQNFLAYHTPEYEIYTNPNLRITALDKQVDVQGSIMIPKARLHPIEDKAHVIKPSADIQFKQTQTTSDIFKLNSHIQLILGNDIDLNIQGLTGQLTGRLSIADTADGSATGLGEITIHNGQYQAYGQHLAIRKGRLLFNLSPLNNPGLAIQAVKTIKVASDNRFTDFGNSSNYTVGVSVQGTLLEPKATLFAEPANLSQTDILSYLLFNKPSSESNNPQTLLQFAASLPGGGNKLEQLKEKLQKGMSLDELEVETNNALNKDNNTTLNQNASIALGKALSPRLYLRYSIGILEPINTLTIRYLLSSKWSLQSTSSTNGNGVDIFYVIER